MPLPHTMFGTQILRDLIALVQDVGPTAEKVQAWLLGDGLRILLTLLLAVVVRWLLHRTIDRFVATMTSRAAQKVVAATRSNRATRALGEATGVTNERSQQRMQTMGSLLKSIVTFVVSLVAALTVMSLVGLPLGPLLASAGVGGVALGFGAQSLVKDFLSGIFMILEDQYGVGDVIDTGEAVGTVEEVTLRVTRLRDANGVTWYVRNGEIIRIANRSQGWSMATVDVPVSYLADVDEVLRVMRGSVAGMADEERWQEVLIEDPDVVGVESIVGQVMTVRTLAKCAANQHWSVQRELRERLKTALDGAGIAPPPTTLPPPTTGL